MKLVADTNVIVAAILRPGITRSLLIHPGLLLYSPQHLAEELDEHKEELMQKSGLKEDAYCRVVNFVLTNVSVVPLTEYRNLKKEASGISPDHDDWPFFAVAAHLSCPIWSNDKRLKKQKKVAIYSTEELVALLPSSQDEYLLGKK